MTPSTQSQKISSSLAHNLGLAATAAERNAFAMAALEEAGKTVFPLLNGILAVKGAESEEYLREREAVLVLLTSAGIRFVRECPNPRWGIDFLDGLASRCDDLQVRKKLVSYTNQLKKRWNELEPGGIHHAPRAAKKTRAEKEPGGSMVAGMAGLAIFLVVAGGYLSHDRTSSVPSGSKNVPRRQHHAAPERAEVRENPALTPPPAAPVVEAVQAKRGSFFEFVDGGGVIHIVDDLEKVPHKYRHRMKVTAAPERTPASPRITSVSVSHNRVLVPVTFTHHGRSVSTTLLLDTGATTTTISENLAARLGIEPAETTPGRSTVADGRTVRSWNVAVETLAVGPRSLSGARVAILPGTGGQGTEGLLGMSFLQQFPHRLDVARGVIEWQ